MWTQAHRETYKQSGRGLPSDLTDAQWERLEPLIPAAKPGGRPRKTYMRAAMNAIFYLLRTGCPWRYLPRGAFPPRSTVYNIFRQFQRDGVWERIWEELHMALREALGREASPTAAILDSQSLKAAEKGEPRAGVKRTQWVMTPASRRFPRAAQKLGDAIEIDRPRFVQGDGHASSAVSISGVVSGCSPRSRKIGPGLAVPLSRS